MRTRRLDLLSVRYGGLLSESTSGKIPLLPTLCHLPLRLYVGGAVCSETLHPTPVVVLLGASENLPVRVPLRAFLEAPLRHSSDRNAFFRICHPLTAAGKVCNARNFVITTVNRSLFLSARPIFTGLAIHSHADGCECCEPTTIPYLAKILFIVLRMS